MPTSGAMRVPADTPLELACVIGCAVQTGVGAVLNTARVEEGRPCWSWGSAASGSRRYRARGSPTRRASSSRTRWAAPRSAAKALGATDFLDPKTDDVVAATRELTSGIGVDYAFETAGGSALVQTGSLATRTGGAVGLRGRAAGGPGDHARARAPLRGERKRLLGCLLGSCNSIRDIPRLLGLWRAGRLDLESLITSRRPLAEINAAIDDLNAQRAASAPCSRWPEA